MNLELKNAAQEQEALNLQLLHQKNLIQQIQEEHRVQVDENNVVHEKELQNCFEKFGEQLYQEKLKTEDAERKVSKAEREIVQREDAVQFEYEGRIQELQTQVS